MTDLSCWWRIILWAVGSPVRSRPGVSVCCGYEQVTFPQLLMYNVLGHIKKPGGPRDRVVKSADITIPHNHSIISALCLVWVRAPLWPHETSQVLLAGVSGVLRFSPHLLIGTVSYELKLN